ncbi:MAG: hypothetical protein ACI4TI_02825 [Christensenellales bacterium]
MKLRDIVKLSATILGLDEILDSSKIYDETFDVEKEYSQTVDGTTKTNEEKIIELMVRCFNLVYQEIATDYIPLIECENIEIGSGSFCLSGLGKKFYKLIKLVDKFGVEVKSEIYDDVLYAKNGNYRIIYCYKPEFATLNSDLNDFGGKLTDRVFALGLNKEYCYVCGQYNESEAFKTKFEDSLSRCATVRKNMVMPKRRWM